MRDVCGGARLSVLARRSHHVSDCVRVVHRVATGVAAPGCARAAVVGLLLAASWPATLHLIMGVQNGIVLSLLGLFVLAWVGIGAPLASTFVARRKCRRRMAWAIWTFLLSSFPLVVLITLPTKSKNRNEA